MKNQFVAFLVGVVAFGVLFLALDFAVMNMQGLSLMFEH